MEAVIASGAVTSYGWIGCRCVPCTTVDTRPPRWSPFRGNLPGLSAEFPLQEEWDTIGAMVARQRMFDIAHAWGSNPPGGGPCFVVTHTAPQEWVKEGSPFTFVADGVESAIRQAKKAAGDKNVAVASANIMQQCLKAGLVDEIVIHLFCVSYR